MGSKSSKWLAASLATLAVGVVPAGAVAKLDYSRNSVSGEYLPSPARLVGQINDVSTPATAAPAPAPVRVAVPVAAKPGSGFAWGDALAGGGAVLLLAFAGMAIGRRRHPSPLPG